MSNLVEIKLEKYLKQVLAEPENHQIQSCPFTTQPWGEVLPQFTRDLGVRLEKSRDTDDLLKLVSPIVGRGAELVSGGIVSAKDIPAGERRGIQRGGTWPDVPGGHFWDPRERQSEQRAILEDILPDVLRSETDASIAHVGRVVTMSLPALIAWADLRKELTPADQISSAVKGMLEAEQRGRFSAVSFGCEPYQYRHESQSTTTHFRRSEFGSDEFIRRDAMHGAFRGVRRILEPLTLSGVDTGYNFYTSFGTSWALIQRQVMPDTLNHYATKETPEVMLGLLDKWRATIEWVGRNELVGSGVGLHMKEMEQEVVLPALWRLGEVLKDCGMEMPDDLMQFCENSDKWFSDRSKSLGLLKAVSKHPNPRLLVNFLINEDQWSQKHPDAYPTEDQRVNQSALLSFFELHQYERINQVINDSDLALGVEIDEELLMMIRSQSAEAHPTPLVWGRAPRYTPDGRVGGVAHRQPWYYG